MNAGLPLVSVIIPSYNSRPWINQTVESVLTQTYPRLETIVVDDASTDDTAGALKHYGSRVKLLRNECNRGVSFTRNRAIAVAQGDYIALLDHDDLWFPEKTTKQMSLFERNPELGLVFSDAVYRRAEGSSHCSFELMAPARGHVFSRLLQTDFIPCASAVIPRKVIDSVGPFREDLSFVEDHELFLRISRSFAIDYAEEPLVVYNVHETNLTRRRDLCQRERITLETLYMKEGGFEGAIALDYLRLGAALFEKRQPGHAAASFTLGALRGLRFPVKTCKALFETLQKRKRANPWKNER